MVNEYSEPFLLSNFYYGSVWYLVQNINIFLHLELVNWFHLSFYVTVEHSLGLFPIVQHCIKSLGYIFKRSSPLFRGRRSLCTVRSLIY